MATDTSLMSGQERMFYEQMNDLGAEIEAFIVRAPRPWFYDIYGYRITRADGSQSVGSMPWNLDTYGKVLAIAKGE